MGSTPKAIKLDSPEAEKYLSELFGVMVTYGSKTGIEMNDKKNGEVTNGDSTESNQG